MTLCRDVAFFFTWSIKRPWGKDILSSQVLLLRSRKNLKPMCPLSYRSAHHNLCTLLQSLGLLPHAASTIHRHRAQRVGLPEALTLGVDLQRHKRVSSHVATNSLQECSPILTCWHSSLVGHTMTAMGPSPGSSSFWSMMWTSIGQMNAAVLPLPVLAIPIMSRPDSAMGTPWKSIRNQKVSVSKTYKWTFNI